MSKTLSSLSDIFFTHLEVTIHNTTQCKSGGFLTVLISKDNLTLENKLCYAYKTTLTLLPVKETNIKSVKVPFIPQVHSLQSQIEDNSTSL